MRQAETNPVEHDHEAQSPDRLTRALILVAFFLALIVIALGTGISLERDAGTPPADDGELARGGDSPPATEGLTGPPGTATPAPAPVTPAPCVVPDDWVPYQVQPGNTLYSLAQRFGTDVDSLKRANCLQDNTIRANEDLYVPGPSVNPGATLVAEALTPETAAGPTPQPVSWDDIKVDFAERFINIILLGSDKREGSSTWRTDTMIVLSADTERNAVRLLSIPRDLWVSIPGHGQNRINSADLWGELAQEGMGPELVKQTVYQNLGVPIHYYVRVDFDGFTKIIDAMGGLDIDVECPLTDIELSPGMHHMDGETALLYARSRITTNDFDRSRRQRKLLMALWDQGLSKEIIPRLPALWIALGDAFETDLPLDQVINLAYFGLQLKRNRIFSQSIGPWQVQNWTTPEGAAVLLPNHAKIQELLNAFYGPIDLDFLERIGQTRVQILNGTQRPEADQLAATALGWAGYQIAGTGLADTQTYTATQILAYNTQQDVAETAGMLLDVPPSSLVYQPDLSKPVDILIILGADYDPCAAK